MTTLEYRTANNGEIEIRICHAHPETAIQYRVLGLDDDDDRAQWTGTPFQSAGYHTAGEALVRVAAWLDDDSPADALLDELDANLDQDRLVNSAGRTVRFEAHQVPGRGWTVAQVVGSRRAGRTTTPVPGYTNTYTLQQAQAAADALTRDTIRRLQGGR